MLSRRYCAAFMVALWLVTSFPLSDDQMESFARINTNMSRSRRLVVFEVRSNRLREFRMAPANLRTIVGQWSLQEPLLQLTLTRSIETCKAPNSSHNWVLMSSTYIFVICSSHPNCSYVILDLSVRISNPQVSNVATFSCPRRSHSLTSFISNTIFVNFSRPSA